MCLNTHTHTHTHTHKHTHSWTHLLVSEPVGNCHMPGRFCNLGRWYSTIRPAESLNQSPACYMKAGALCVCSTNVLVHFVFWCLVCKLPAFSHTTNRFCCLAVPEKCFFPSLLFPLIFSLLPSFSASYNTWDFSLSFSTHTVLSLTMSSLDPFHFATTPLSSHPVFLYPFLPLLLACLTTGLNARLYWRQ